MLKHLNLKHTACVSKGVNQSNIYKIVEQFPK